MPLSSVEVDEMMRAMESWTPEQTFGAAMAMHPLMQPLADDITALLGSYEQRGVPATATIILLAVVAGWGVGGKADTTVPGSGEAVDRFIGIAAKVLRWAGESGFADNRKERANARHR